MNRSDLAIVFVVDHLAVFALIAAGRHAFNLDEIRIELPGSHQELPADAVGGDDTAVHHRVDGRGDVAGIEQRSVMEDAPDLVEPGRTYPKGHGVLVGARQRLTAVDLVDIPTFGLAREVLRVGEIKLLVVPHSKEVPG